MRTAILSGRIPNAAALTAGTDFVLNAPAWAPIALNLDTVIKTPSGLATIGKDDAIYLDAVRIYCNFADGLVPANYGTQLPVILWHGGTRPTPPPESVSITTQILNEWFPVEMQIPRDETTVALYGGIMAGFFGAMTWHTDSISSDFDGKIPFFEIQCRIKSAYI